jgi:hypothetical protein
VLFVIRTHPAILDAEKIEILWYAYVSIIRLICEQASPI